jgi:hypothetical protein
MNGTSIMPQYGNLIGMDSTGRMPSENETSFGLQQVCQCDYLVNGRKSK